MLGVLCKDVVVQSSVQCSGSGNNFVVVVVVVLLLLQVKSVSALVLAFLGLTLINARHITPSPYRGQRDIGGEKEGKAN